MPTHTAGHRGQRTPKKEFDPFRDVPRAQELTREGVIASGELLRPEILGRIGDTLSGLNSIGALRSGGTTVALRDLNRDFTDRIGNIASRATLGAVDSGLSAGRLRFQNDEAKRRRRSGLFSAIGKTLLTGGLAIATSGASLPFTAAAFSGGGRESLLDRDIFKNARVGAGPGF